MPEPSRFSHEAPRKQSGRLSAIMEWRAVSVNKPWIAIQVPASRHPVRFSSAAKWQTSLGRSKFRA